MARTTTDLVVFSHLRWGFVFQRPQHLVSRLAGRWRVFFVEEPVRCAGAAHLTCHEPLPGVTVVVPHTPVLAPGFHDDQIAVLEPLLARHFAEQGVDDGVAWLYTPMALPLMGTARPRAVVYDCMDELAAFKDAPRQLRQRENALLKRADLVLTGGPSLYEAKRMLHPQVVCLPSAVDAAHFSPAGLDAGSEAARRVAARQDALPRPRLGFFGVIDERLDTALVAALADARPDWAIVMAGPVVKIDAAGLPQRPNLHWLGMQAYDDLPHLLAGWDLALMPFALNESTRFISPTKTLEYMAGGKPVVSTPVHDVCWLYGDTVAVAADAAGFVDACERLLAEPDEARERRVQAMRHTVATRSWDHAADEVHQRVAAAWQQAQPAVVPGADATLVAPVAAATTPLAPADGAGAPKLAAGGIRGRA